MNHRRRVGIDLGIASAHTVCVLDGERTTMVRADTARKQDPQLVRIDHVQMVERGRDHLGALCVVAANLAERAWAVI